MFFAPHFFVDHEGICRSWGSGPKTTTEKANNEPALHDKKFGNFGNLLNHDRCSMTPQMVPHRLIVHPENKEVLYR